MDIPQIITVTRLRTATKRRTGSSFLNSLPDFHQATSRCAALQGKSVPKRRAHNQGKSVPKGGGVNCWRKKLGTRERTKDVHVLRRPKGLLRKGNKEKDFSKEKEGLRTCHVKSFMPNFACRTTLWYTERPIGSNQSLYWQFGHLQTESEEYFIWCRSRCCILLRCRR